MIKKFTNYFTYIVHILRKRKRRSIIILICLVVLFGGYALFQRTKSIDRSAPEGHMSPQVIKNPPFKTIAPKGKSVEKDLNGWRRISPEDSDLVVAYTDTLASVTIQVSEQKIPRDIKGSDTKLRDLAKAFGATNKLSVKDTPTYIGSSVKGNQSVLLTKNDLLILIRSKGEISDSDWIRYITSLE